MTKKVLRFISAITIFAVLSGVFPAGATAWENTDYREADYPASFAKFSGAKGGWDNYMPSPLKNIINTAKTTATVVNDGSAEMPAESYLALDDIEGGVVILSFGFNMDRVIDGTAFKLVGKKQAILSIVTKGMGLYLEQPEGKAIYLCSYKPMSTQDRGDYVVNAVLDMDNHKIIRLQINGKTCASDAAFMTETSLADGFDITTSDKGVGVVSCTSVFIDRGYFINEMFKSGEASIPDDWDLYSDGGNAVITVPNTPYSYRNFLTLDTVGGGVRINKSIDGAEDKISFEINVLQPEKRGGFSISLKDRDKKAIEFTSDGRSFCYTNENGIQVPFYEYIKNVWYNLEVHIDTKLLTYDLDLNNRPLLKGLKLPDISKITSVDIRADKNDVPLCVKDILLYRTRPFADDYPVIGEIPAKKQGAPLVGIQMCPMWTQGNHFGWDWIKQASDRREPVTGFYDQPSAEQADWNIKHMVEHGVDYMSICMFPHDADANGSVEVSQITDKDYRSTSYISAVQNARYSDKIKYSIFLEANGIRAGHAYYDSFFNTVWPHYIEHYFKDPRYLKINGRPVFGCYSVGNLYNVFNDGRGAVSVREGVQRMRQMCIEAGVGDPYLIVNNGGYQVGLAASGGFDAVSSYGLGYEATSTYQKTIFKSTLEECKKSGVDFIVSPVPMRDDTAWRINAGYWHTKEETEELLSWVRNDLLSGYTPKAGQTLCNMCTWDEYGEGHIISPTVGLGFRYLDAVREAFTNGGEHTDEFLTDAQKKRITHLYRQDRKIGNVIYESTVDYKVFYEAREKDIPEKIPADVKKGWYFTKPGSAGIIAAVADVESVKTGAGGIEVYPSGRQPRIRFTELEGIDVYDVPFVKIRMKKNPTSGGGFFYWSGDVVPGINNDKKIFFNAGTDDGREFKDYYVPVASCVSWTGKVDNIEIVLGDVSDTSSPFVIESIEMLWDKEEDKKDKLIVDSRVQSLTDAYEIKDSTLMVPLKEVMYMAGAELIEYAVVLGKLSVSYKGNISVAETGKKEALINGENVSLPQAPYQKSEIINDTVYVPLSFVEGVLGDKEISFDSAQRTLTVLSGEEIEEEVNKEIIHRVDYDEETDVVNPHGITAITVKDGKMTATTSNNDPNFALLLNKSAESIKFIQMKINTNSPQNLKYYFVTNKDSRWGEDKGSGMVTTVSGNNTIMFDTSMVSTWKDTITTFRIDPSTQSGNTFSLDSVIFYGEDLQPVMTAGAAKKDMSSCITLGGGKLEWNFNKNTDLDGWQLSKSLGNVTLGKGVLSAVIAGDSAALTNRKDIDIDTSDIDKITVKYVNVTNSENFSIYFTTTDNKAANDNCRFIVPVKPMDSAAHEFVIDVKDNKAWTGILKRLVIVPEKCTKGRISVDSISLIFKEGADK